MSGKEPSALSSLNRALFWTRLVMIWERLLPVFFPFVLLALLVAVAAQWGLFLRMNGGLHAAILVGGFALAMVAAVRGAMRFRLPDFVQLNARVAVDNGLRPERILAMYHQVEQPPLKIGRAKAGIATADPYALRYVALVAAMLGFLVLGPVPLSRVEGGFCPFGKTVHSFAEMSLAQK